MAREALRLSVAVDAAAVEDVRRRLDTFAEDVRSGRGACPPAASGAALTVTAAAAA